MALSLVTPEDVPRRLALRLGAPDFVEALSDIVRAEVHARKHAPRAVTVSRVARLLAPSSSLEEQVLDEACSALEREGDVMLAPGGILFATPTRVVVLKTSARVFSSVPTRALEAALGREVAAKGATRTVASVHGLMESVVALGGATITPEAWAGLDSSPPADAEFLASLEERLEWQARPPGSLERDGILEWRTWQPTPDGMGWRFGGNGRLWWARHRFGGHYWAWTASGSPATSRFVDLSPVEADRARFALARNIAGASVLRVVRSGKSVALEVPSWLPRPEYRWLSLHASPTPDKKGLGWEAAADDESMITTLLAERLGLVVEVT